MTLKGFRLLKGWSQQEAADWLKEKTGVSITQAHWQSWEAGSVPRKPMREMIQAATGGKVKPASFL